MQLVFPSRAWTSESALSRTQSALLPTQVYMRALWGEGRKERGGGDTPKAIQNQWCSLKIPIHRTGRQIPASAEKGWLFWGYQTPSFSCRLLYNVMTTGCPSAIGDTGYPLSARPPPPLSWLPLANRHMILHWVPTSMWSQGLTVTGSVGSSNNNNNR